MIEDIDLRFRMTRRSAALTHGEPRTFGVRNLVILVVLVVVLALASVVLGVPPQSLLDALG